MAIKDFINNNNNKEMNLYSNSFDQKKSNVTFDFYK